MDIDVFKKWVKSVDVNHEDERLLIEIMLRDAYYMGIKKSKEIVRESILEIGLSNV